MMGATYTYHLPTPDTPRNGHWIVYGPPEPNVRFESYPSFSNIPEEEQVEPIRHGDFKIDLDSKDDVMKAVRDARLAVEHFETVYGIGPEAWSIYLSGSKGVHLSLRDMILDMEEGHRLLPLVYKRLALDLAGNAGLTTLDASLYCMGSGRPFRLPNRKRENGFYKVPITFDELCGISDVEDYKKLCSAPRNEPEKVAPTRSELLAKKVTVFTAEAEEASREKPEPLDDMTTAKLRETVPPCIEVISRTEKMPRSGKTFNDVAMQLIGYAVTAGLTEAESIGLCETALHKYPSPSNTPYKDRLRDFRTRYRHMKAHNMEFSCGGIKALSFSGFDCTTCTVSDAEKDVTRNCDEWPEPSPLAVKIAPQAYPTDALPETIRAAVEEVRDFVQAPVPLIAGSALSAVSLASQAQVDVERASKLTGPCSLNFLTIAESGERKTTSDRCFMTAIRNYEAEQAEFAKPEIKKYEAEVAAWSSKKAGLLDAIKAASKAGNSCTALEAKLQELQQAEPAPPRVPRLLYLDTTPEALVRGLAREWPSGGVVSSEAGAVFGSHGMGKDSLMRNLSTYNQLWDGGPIRFDRRTEGGSFTLRGARLTVSLQVQESTLRAFFEKAGDLPRGTGFLARFLVACPESTQGTRFFKEPPDRWQALAAFHTRISEMLNMPAPVNEDVALEPKLLTLSPEAKEAWILFHDTVERELRCGGELTDVRDVASKAADNVARLAALFHVFEHGLEGDVQADHIEAAGRLVAWHLNEARRFFGEIALSAEAGNVARLDAWLLEYCRTRGTDVVPNVDIQRYGPNQLRRKDSLETALSELVDMGRVRLLKEGKRKSVQVNPLLQGGPL